MFKNFAETLCKSLIAKDYYIASAKEDVSLTNNTPLVMLARNLSPVFSMVNIINAGSVPLDTLTNTITPLSQQMEVNLSQMHCESAICLNIIVCQRDAIIVKDYIDKKELVRGEKINQCWWMVDLQNNKLLFGKEQPTKVMGLETMVASAIDLKSYSKEEAEEVQTIKTMEMLHRAKSSLPVLSNNTKVTYCLILANLLVWAYIALTGSEQYFFAEFANNSSLVLNGGQYYRLITSIFLHGGFMHVGYNCLSIYIFGSRCEKYFGKVKYLLIYFVAGLGGSIASCFLTKGISVGASGAVFGIVGALIAFCQSEKRDVEGISYFTILLFAIVGISMGFMDTGVDNFAHIGGIFTGYVLQWAFIKGFAKKVGKK